MPDALPESVLRFDRVTVSFDGVPALRDISFEVLKGQARIILGAASSGKPGWPLSAFCTASMDNVRRVLTQS